MAIDRRLALVGSMVAALAVGACSGPKERPLPSSFQNGSGNSQGDMAYPTPLPQGNILVTPVR